MSWLILCLALATFVCSAPPIVPVKPEEAVVAAVAPKLTPCVDGVNNVVQIADVKGSPLRIRTEDAVAYLYDSTGEPSCYNGRARISLPGFVKLVRGKVIVTAPSDIKKSGEVKFTFTSVKKLIGTLCKDGNPLNKLIPEAACHHTLYPDIGKDFATMLSTPGTYDMEKIRETAGVGPMIALPSINPAIKLIVRGDWQAYLNIVSEGQTIAHIKAPSNGDWLYID